VRNTSAPLVAIILLLASSIFINYIDRANLSIAAPLLRRELRLTGSELGFILSAFFWTYAFFQLPAGWLADRYDVKWVLAIGFGLWSVATALTGVVDGFVALLVVRLLLGVGESVAYPSYSRILVQHFREDLRGRANSAIAAGLACGPAIGMLGGGLLVARIGWRPFFVGLGVTSLLWLLPWMLVMPRSDPSAHRSASDAPSVDLILRERAVWGTCLGLFGANFFNYFLLTWLPSYLVGERHFSMDRMAVTGGACYFVVAASALACGWVADHRIASGASTPHIRKAVSAAGLAIAGMFLVLAAVTSADSFVALLLIASAGFGVFSSNHWAATQTMAGPLACGRWTGIENFVGNLAGTIAPAVTGVVLDWTGQYFWAFAIASGLALLGAASWTFVIRDVREVDWGAARQRHLADARQ
jgi:ACS family D-galactonate transporter-like MFS transporter